MVLEQAWGNPNNSQNSINISIGVNIIGCITTVFHEFLTLFYDSLQ